ncbi:hypothetical protein OPV22_015566 [Ensete ventricosum]|uniref:Uncharacterized protein n=1 Tax=Ensete ventricosum TaxID=4639 RepID=A0AAV8R463_ENSVE|nr:hypothetical protein OPV22_015566 [Ensete ventricosum]
MGYDADMRDGGFEYSDGEPEEHPSGPHCCLSQTGITGYVDTPPRVEAETKEVLFFRPRRLETISIFIRENHR